MLGFATNPSPVTRLLLIRHGQSLWNQIGRIQGQQDIELSPLGQRQAQALGTRLAPIPLSAVYASPLRRARETAQAVATPHRLPVRLNDDLAEIHHGIWEGLTVADLEERFGDLLHLWRTAPSQVQMPDGEHFNECLSRGLRAVTRIAADHPGETVAVVTHDVIVRCVVADTLGMPPDHVTRFTIDNTSISIVEYTSPPIVACVNDTAHLLVPFLL
jgi:broad specificity phosphatase PhoE